VLENSVIQTDTIVALATGNNIGAIAVIRLSGKNAIEICNKIFVGADLEMANTHTLHFGKIQAAETIIDEVLVSVFKDGKSYTGQNTVEISCHGSKYICKQIIALCIANGCRLAEPGEFTQRAFLNGKLDLSQAEAVADLIASENKSQHKIAMQQMRGGISSELQNMRNELITFASLLELELDFSEEDVEFADRTAFQELLHKLQIKLKQLANSFALGNAIKTGIPVAIIGKPNAGKSTLLNILLQEDRAIVSEIAGTTRDTIEDIIHINGIAFRFIDTAGIRKSDDIIESIGIAKTFEKIKNAQIILLMADAAENMVEITLQYKSLNIEKHQSVIIVLNKIDAVSACDAYDKEEALMTTLNCKAIAISAKTKMHTEKLENLLLDIANLPNADSQDVIVSNVRHLSAIELTLDAIANIKLGFDQNISGELVAIDVKRALHYLGSITGQVEVDRDILGTIFGKFCIGK
jgi:tRNA modification GTPase